MPRAGIIDYGMGNLRSVEKGLEKAGVASEICADPERLGSYDGLILPGVGAFRDAMENLTDLGMDRAIKDFVSTGRHLLGICLGMQLMLDYSEEHGRNEGLGMIGGGCLRLPDSVKVPHMGWNILKVKQQVPLFEGLSEGDRFYFVHSFYCAPTDEDVVIGTTDYGLEFACAIRKDNVWGMQFHPEKSSLLGLHILENFGRLIGAA